MPRLASFFVMFASLCIVPAAFAQGATSTATCNFDEDKQIVLDYQRVQVNLKKPLSAQVPFGKVWAPGGKPMTLFTNTPVEIHARMLPVGAYTLFVIPGAKQWTLIVSKSTDTTGAYDEAQDLVRAPMDSGELPSPESEFSAAFEHVGPGECNIRL
ncbi:MAG: DUF2911 domain-containing protein, partial [Candidatus Korobacteraceae bacterium]